MPGMSAKTQIISIRLPNEVAETIRRRCDNNRFESVSAYLRDRITYDITRKHSKHRRVE